MASLISSKLVAPASAAARCCVNISEQSVAGLEDGFLRSKQALCCAGVWISSSPATKITLIRTQHACTGRTVTFTSTFPV